jgi:hypothetical protein
VLTHTHTVPGGRPGRHRFGGTELTLAEVIDDHFLSRYRVLLDAEDVAFDELEHAFEDGDRAHFEADLEAWRNAICRKLAYLERFGISITATTASTASG